MFNFSENPLAEILTEQIGHQVCIDNDTRAMTYGEYMQGCVNGEKNIIFLEKSIDAVQVLPNLIDENTLVFLKGSRGIKLENAIPMEAR